MTTLVALYMIVLAAVLLAVPAYQAYTGKEEVVSVRNFFILGLVIFQVTGAAISILTDDISHFQPVNMESSSVIYAFMLTVFVAIFGLTYRSSTGLFDRLFARRAHGVSSFSRASLLVIAATSVLLGLLCKFVLVYIPVLGPGFERAGAGMYVVAVGLATWAAVGRLYNPVYVVPAVAIVLTTIFLSMNFAFGRRTLLGLVIVIMWAAYFGHWRNLGLRATVTRAAFVAGAGLVLLALVTSARTGAFRQQTAAQNLSALKGASIQQGLVDLATGQRAALNSMWLIESRPQSMEYDTLHSVRLFLLFPIPRWAWAEKPTALAITMAQDEIYVQNVGKDWNVGPGIIGHIENDNPFLALWMYPIILGVMIRFLDRATSWFASNPFIVLPIGTIVGQIVGVPRGELGAFLFLGVINVVSTYVLMKVVSIGLRTLGLVRFEPHGWDDQQTWTDHEDAALAGATDETGA